ncbi:hypothetical protein ACFL3B_00040 [Gemmatimonadota bacterium]
MEKTIEFFSSTMQLNGDGTFSVVDENRITEVVTDAAVNISEPTVTFDNATTVGTFTVTGASILLTTSGGSESTASLSGDVLTITVNGVLWVWER